MLLSLPYWVVRAWFEARRGQWQYRVEPTEVLHATELDRLTVIPRRTRPMFPPEHMRYREMYIHPHWRRGWWWAR